MNTTRACNNSAHSQVRLLRAEQIEKLTQRGRHELFTSAGRAMRRHHFVSTLLICLAVGDVAERSVGEFHDDRIGEWRILFEGKAQLHKNFTRHTDKRKLVSAGDGLYFGIQESAMQCKNVHIPAGAHEIEKRGC